MGKSGGSHRWRRLVSFYLLFASLALLVSGVVLFIAPSGRVARSTDWRLLGLDKGQWEALHTWFGYTGALFGILHLALNWRALLSYLRDRLRQRYTLRPEVAVALALALLVGIGSALYLPPFSTLMDLGERAKGIWESGNPSASVERGGASWHQDGARRGAAIAGRGRLTVAELCAQYGVPVDEGLARLQANGIAADPGTRVRELLTHHTPTELVEMITEGSRTIRRPRG